MSDLRKFTRDGRFCTLSGQRFCASQRTRQQPWTAAQTCAAGVAQRGSRDAPAGSRAAKKCRCRTTRCRRDEAPPQTVLRQPCAQYDDSGAAHMQRLRLTHQQMATQRPVRVREALAAVGVLRPVCVHNLQRVAGPEQHRARAHAHCVAESGNSTGVLPQARAVRAWRDGRGRLHGRPAQLKVAAAVLSVRRPGSRLHVRTPTFPARPARAQSRLLQSPRRRGCDRRHSPRRWAQGSWAQGA